MPAFDMVILAWRGPGGRPADAVLEALALGDADPQRHRRRTMMCPRLRARFPGRQVAQLVPLFLAFPRGRRLPLVDPAAGAFSLVTWEGDERRVARRGNG